MNAQDEGGNRGVAKRVKQGFVIFAAIAAFFLLAEHRAHVLAFLPWLLLAACPLMHVFMHHGKHGHHNEDAQSNSERVVLGGSHHG
jgi:Protein of unknown function (DUF2933)